MRKSSENEEKVSRRIKNPMCIAKMMSPIGRSGKGPRWRTRRQLAELCMQGWINNEYEPALEEWKVCLKQKEGENKKADRLEQHKAWV